MIVRFILLTAALLGLALRSAPLSAQAPQPDWARVEAETMEHFQALLRFDTRDPPGIELPAAQYLKQILEKEGIQPLRLRTESRAITACPAQMCSGRASSISRPARHSRLMNPETSSVENMAASRRNSRLLADTPAATPTRITASENSSPPRVMR